MTKPIKDICVASSKYETGGKTKSNWVKVGLVWKSDEGKEFRTYFSHINWAAFPQEKGSVIASEFDIKAFVSEETHKGFDKQGDIAKPQSDDDIPF